MIVSGKKNQFEGWCGREGREQQASGGNREPEQRAVLKIRLLAPHTEAGLQGREGEGEGERERK